jgi:hypothetical protein
MVSALIRPFGRFVALGAIGLLFWLWTAPASAAPDVFYGQSGVQGDWVGQYGADGYVLAGWSGGRDVTAMPGVDVSLVQGNRWLWASNTADVRALQSADKSARAAATFWDSNEIQVRLTFRAAYSGNLALYALDADYGGRRETITVAGQSADLSGDFSRGAWVTLPINVAAGASVTIDVDRTAGVNAVLSGIFLGGGGTPPPLPPTNTGLPVITGSAVQTHTLSTSNGTWTGSPSSYAYQWQACDADGHNCAAISGAVASGYTLTSSDVGHTIRVVVSAGNAGGSASQASSSSGVVTAPSPSGPSDSGPCGVQGGPYNEGDWPTGTWVPYVCTSPWNTQLPAYGSARLDPGSQTEISYMDSNWSPHFTSQSASNDPAQDTASIWADPVYWARTSDPTYTVEADHPCGAPAATSCPSSVQIPDGAVPSSGSDAHLAVVQPDGHTEVDFWQVHNAPPLHGGGTLSASAYGALDLNGSGCCGNSTAANEGLLAGAIRAPELAAGVIKHALAVTEVCSNGAFVSPATGRGAGGCPNAPPIGARMQLKMSDAQIGQLNVPAYQKTILTAMTHYGIFITDTGGSPMDLKYEPAVQYTEFANTSNTIMSYLETQGNSDPAWIDLKLPWSDFQVVSPCYAQATC